jgi:hypothetical protein
MNSTLKTVLLTVLTLSAFTIAMIELTGVSSNKLSTIFSKKPKVAKDDKLSMEDIAVRDSLAKSMPQTSFQFDSTKHNFGTIKEGDKVQCQYHFTNTGNQPLFISNVVVSCGCTVPSFSKEPITPGARGSITLEFNSAGKEGAVTKNSQVIANVANSPFPLSFSANVLEK